jgi:hypothetical protein
MGIKGGHVCTHEHAAGCTHADTPPAPLAAAAAE